MITLYTKDYCPFCVQAKTLLSSLGIPFTEVDITDDPDTMMSIAKKSGMRTVPQVFLGDECLGWYTDIAELHQKGELLSRVGM